MVGPDEVAVVSEGGGVLVRPFPFVEEAKAFEDDDEDGTDPV